jgi:hypothetical protein
MAPASNGDLRTVLSSPSPSGHAPKRGRPALVHASTWTDGCATRLGSAGDSLLDVTSPELYRRVDRAEQDLTAISDTVLDIKDTVDQHTGELAAIKRIQDQHTELLNQHTELLNEILRRLDAR